MPIAFEQIPSAILAPLFYAEIKPEQTPFNAALKLLLIGAKNNGVPYGQGIAVDNTPYILSDDRAETLFGRGSMLSAMYKTARANAPFIEIWGMSEGETVGAVRAVGTILVKADPTKNEILTFMVGGIGVSVPVRSTDTRAALAARIVANMGKLTHLPCVASLQSDNTSQVNLTCRWGGTSGQGIRIEANYFGEQNAAATRLLTITPFGGSSGGGQISPALAAIGDQDFDVICRGEPIGNATAPILADFMDGVAGRWSPYQQLYGHVVTGLSATFSDLITFADPLNDPHTTVIGATAQPHPIWCWSAALAAVMTQHWAAPPELSRPLQSLELRGLLPPSNPINWFDITERNSLLAEGITTYRVDQDRTVRIDRERTLYKRNVYGDQDQSWADAITMFQVMYFVRFMRGQITGTFPRAALTTQETGIPGFASPGAIKDLLVHAYRFLERQGLVENTALFAEALIVERNPLDANRVDILARPDLVNQLRIVAALVQSNLQLNPLDPTGIDTLAA